jgi:hypothetical protein
MRLAIVLLALVGCATTRPAVPGSRATVSVQEFRRHDQPTRWIAKVNNPTSEVVYIDCEEARIPIAPGTQSDVLLMPDDVHCDLVNGVEYVNDTGQVAPSRRRHTWARHTQTFRMGS